MPSTQGLAVDEDETSTSEIYLFVASVPTYVKSAELLRGKVLVGRMTDVMGRARVSSLSPGPPCPESNSTACTAGTVIRIPESDHKPSDVEASPVV